MTAQVVLSEDLDAMMESVIVRKAEEASRLTLELLTCRNPLIQIAQQLREAIQSQVKGSATFEFRPQFDRIGHFDLEIRLQDIEDLRSARRVTESVEGVRNDQVYRNNLITVQLLFSTRSPN